MPTTGVMGTSTALYTEARSAELRGIATALAIRAGMEPIVTSPSLAAPPAILRTTEATAIFTALTGARLEVL